MIDLTQFLQLFNQYPGSHYMQITKEPDDITKKLYDLLDANGKFSLVIYGEETNLQNFENANIKYVKNLDEPFRALPRSNDVIILKDIFSSHKNQDILLKTAYSSLANTANIIIMEKLNILDIEKTKQKLEKFEFRASNNIDIVDGYDLIIAKKMHMWGNGL